jgi:predicted PurR-regulated permease PerM
MTQAAERGAVAPRSSSADMKPGISPPADRRSAEPAAGDPAMRGVPGVAGVPVVRIPVDARGLALTILAVVAVVAALDWAQAFFVSLLVGVVLAYMLSPLVAVLERTRMPRVMASMIVMATVVGALVLGGYTLRGQVQTIVEGLPAAASKFSAGVARLRISQLGTMQKMQSAASVVQKATSEATGGPSIQREPATHVVIDQPTFKVGDYLWLGSKGAVGAAGQAVMVLFLTFFLLVGGDIFKRKLVRLAGPTLSNKKITVQIVDEINESIQKYLFMMLLTNALVGLLVWAALAWIGMENAGAWAVVAALLHVIPYLGPGVTAAATGMAAFMQFDSFPMALLVSGSTVLVATFVGVFVTTWMTGRIARMNSAAVFISLLFWGWLWGVWGMLLGIPIIVIVKAVSQHVEQLQPVAELLGE